jgi:hypothetical protein
LDGINPLDQAHQPNFARARAFVERCSALLNPDGHLPVSKFELARFAKLAPYLCVLGVIDAGEDFEIRLVGTRLVEEFFGGNPTGAKLSQAVSDDEFGRRSWHILRETMRTKHPVLNQPGRTRLKSRDYMLLETVNYPLVDAAGTVVKIAALYDYQFEKAPAAAF